MNKMTTLIAAFGISMGAPAQSYDKLWQEAKAHVDNDLPKSAIEVVNKIQQKAVAEGNDAQLLRVMLTQRMLGAELSADSVAPWLQRMEAALAAETKPAMQALWHVALAKCYEGTNYGQVLVIDGKTLAYDALQQRAKHTMRPRWPTPTHWPMHGWITICPCLLRMKAVLATTMTCCTWC